MMRQRVRTIYWLLRGQARRGPAAFLRALGRILLRGLGRRDALDVYRPIVPVASRGWFGRGTPAMRRHAARMRVLGGDWSPRLTPVAVEPVRGRVLHVVGKSLPQATAGFTVRTHHIARAQAAIGLDPVVVTRLGFPWEVGEEAAERVERVDGIAYHRLGTGPGPAMADAHLDANLRALKDLVTEVRPAVLHAHSDFNNGLLALAVGAATGIPVVYEVRGFWEETWLSKSEERDTGDDEYRLRREREVECMTRADHVVTLAATMVDRMREDGVETSRVTIVPNAVDPDMFPFSADRDTGILETLGIRPDSPTIGYISSLVGYEGVETLVEATALLRRAGSDVHALVVGDGPERERLESLARAFGVADTVHFTGRVGHAEVPRYYRAIDLFVVPRRDLRVTRLVQPLKPFEALSTGRPLVVSDLPALSEIVHGSDAGATFVPGDPDDLARVLGELIADPDRRRAMGEAGARWVREHHTWEANARRYEEIYRSLGAL